MSNYLDHLVSRSLGYTDRVKPRVPSLFEPLSETIGLSSALAGEENVLTVPSTSEKTELGGSNPQAFKVQELEPQVRTQQLSSSTSFPGQESSSPIVIPSKADHRLIEETPQPQAQPLLSPLSNPSAISLLRSPQPLVIEHRVESAISASQSTATPTRQVKASSAPETDSARSEQGIIPTGTTITPVVLSAMSPMPVEKTPAIRPAVVTFSPASLVSPSEAIASPQPASSLPTIHVTIGRIEVRATPPAATQPKPRSVSPVMNLDEYLRQRGGGK